jgi:hypothetical protein
MFIEVLLCAQNFSGTECDSEQPTRSLLLQRAPSTQRDRICLSRNRTTLDGNSTKKKTKQFHVVERDWAMQSGKTKAGFSEEGAF